MFNRKKLAIVSLTVISAFTLGISNQVNAKEESPKEDKPVRLKKNPVVEFVKYLNPIPNDSYTNESQDRVIKKRRFKFVEVKGASPVTNPELGYFAILPLDKLNDSQTISNLLAKKEINGLSVLLPWQNLEPNEFKYDWSKLDALLKTVKEANKKLIVRVSTCGLDNTLVSDTPEWVFEAGAKSIDFYGVDGEKHKMPIFWDSTYLAKWSNFVSAMGDRYDRNESIHSVGITGGGILGSTKVIPNFVTLKKVDKDKDQDNDKGKEEEKETVIDSSAKTPVEEATEKETKESSTDAKEEAVEKDAKESSDDAKEEAVEKDAQESSDNAKEEAVEKDAKESSDDAKKEAVEKDAKESSDDAKEEAVEKDAKESSDDAKEEAVEKDAKESSDDAKEEAVEKDAQKDAEEEEEQYDVESAPSRKNYKLLYKKLKKDYGMSERQLVEHWKYVADIFPNAFKETRLNFDVNPPIKGGRGQSGLDEISDYLIYRYGQRVYLTRQDIKNSKHGFNEYRVLLKFHFDTITGYQLSPDFKLKYIEKLAKNALVDGISFVELPINLIESKDEKVVASLEKIHSHLGYQLVSRKVSLPKDIKVGESLKTAFSFVNLGSASALNPKRSLDKDTATSYKIQLEFRNQKGKPIMRSLHTPDIPTNKWKSGKPIEWEEELKMAPQLKPGKYDVFMSLIDTETKHKLNFLNEVKEGELIAGKDAPVGSVTLIQ